MDDLKQNIRKWNHDILTHMIGITYLMDMQRYPEAEHYCEKILNSLSSFSETFRAHTMSPDSDSVSESHVPTDYLLIPMDAILIEQVLINLLENALIHSGSNHSPELTVTDHPDHVTFCVKDFGHGLNPDVIPDIFSGICHNTGSVDSHKGMGIGLSICKTIIDAHNGYIEAKNHTNGALFLFTLPKEEEENIPCSQK